MIARLLALLGCRAYRSDIGLRTPYMERWIFEHPLGTVRLHHILRSDDDRALHDHPWWFCSLLLTGGYTEVRPLFVMDPKVDPSLHVDDAIHGPFVINEVPRWSLVYRRASDAHRLVLHEGPVWTLVITGARARRWGFFARNGWVYWREFIDKYGGPESAAYIDAALGRHR